MVLGFVRCRRTGKRPWGQVATAFSAWWAAAALVGAACIAQAQGKSFTPFDYVRKRAARINWLLDDAAAEEEQLAMAFLIDRAEPLAK